MRPRSITVLALLATGLAAMAVAALVRAPGPASAESVSPPPAGPHNKAAIPGRPGSRRPAAATTGAHHPAPGGQARLRSAGRPIPAVAAPRVPLPPVPQDWTIRDVSMEQGGLARYYLVARPVPIRSGPLPVLMVLPGRYMTPARVEVLSHFLSLVGPAVVVYPGGYGNSWNAGYCCGVAHRANVNDVAFLEQVLRSVLATQPGTSQHAVYITGFSNGGRMALDMACADAGAFAGVAAVEAVSVAPCSRSLSVPVIDIASTGDPLITISDDRAPKRVAGRVEVTVEAMMAHLRALEGCTAEVVRRAYSAAAVTEWPACRTGGRVALAVYDGGRHTWPHGGPGIPGAQVLIWDFFSNHLPKMATTVSSRRQTPRRGATTFAVASSGARGRAAPPARVLSSGARTGSGRG